MKFFMDYPVFSSGRFFDCEGRIKAHVDRNNLVRTEYEGKIVGRIRNGKLYDEAMNYVGYFKDGALHSFGGNIIGYCGLWKPLEVIEDKDVKSYPLAWVGIAIGLGCLILKIIKVFGLF